MEDKITMVLIHSVRTRLISYEISECLYKGSIDGALELLKGDAPYRLAENGKYFVEFQFQSGAIITFRHIHTLLNKKS